MTIEVSNSEIQTFKRCRRKWYLRYVRRLQPQAFTATGPLAFGSRIHKVMENHYRDGSDLQEVHTQLVEADRFSMAAAGLDPAELDNEADLGRIMLEGYQDWVAENGLDSSLKVIGAEEILQTPMLDGRVTLQGKIDLRITNTHDGSRSALDFKHQPLDETVLTVDGWKLMGDITAGDMVLGSRWTPVKVLSAFPPSEEPVYEVIFDNQPDRAVRASASHEWSLMEGRFNTETLKRRQEKKQTCTPQLPEQAREGTIQEDDEHAYALGIWLIDGYVRPEDDDSVMASLKIHRLPTNERFIPTLLISRLGFYGRARLLQGIFDLAATIKSNKAKTKDQLLVQLPNERFAHDVVLLVRSLGGHATVKPVEFAPAAVSIEDWSAEDAADKQPKMFEVLVHDLPIPPFRWAKYFRNKAGDRWSTSHARPPRITDVRFIGYEQCRCIRIDADDGLYVTRDGWLTHNTSANFADVTTTAHMDEQGMTYLTLDRLNTPEEIRIDSFVLRLLRKVKRTARAQPPFFEQITVHHNVFTLRNFWNRLNGVLRDLVAVRDALDQKVDHTLVAYPTPARDCRYTCSFFSVCPLFDDGSAIETALQDMFKEADPYSYYRSDVDDNSVAT